MKMSREELRSKYLEAFAHASPESEVPDLAYENGWWVFRFSRTGRILSQVREAELRQMMERLCERVSAAKIIIAEGNDHE